MTAAGNYVVQRLEFMNERAIKVRTLKLLICYPFKPFVNAGAMLCITRPCRFPAAQRVLLGVWLIQLFGVFLLILHIGLKLSKVRL